MISMKKLRVVNIAVLCMFLLIIILQNTEAVETKILFASISMPRALLLVITFLLGLVTGLMVSANYIAWKSKAKAGKDEKG